MRRFLTLSDDRAAKAAAAEVSSTLPALREGLSLPTPNRKFKRLSNGYAGRICNWSGSLSP